MKHRATLSIVLSILAPVFLLAILSQSMAQAAGEVASANVHLAPLVDEADLGISKAGSSDPIFAGEKLTYTLTISNSGLISATNVVVTDTLPANVTVDNVSTSQGGACTENTQVVCPPGNLDVGATAWVTIETTVDSGASGTLQNTAEVDSDTAEFITVNNSAMLETTVDSLADLSVGKVAQPNPAVAGGLITYSIVINNNGPSDASNVTISDTIPLSTTFVSASVVQEATIVHVIDTSMWDPSSPDPAGLAYLPSTDRLMVSDSEVNEPPNNRIRNLFDTTRSGDLFRVTTTTDFTNEPTGLTYDPSTNILYVSDDFSSRRKVFVVRPGSDSIFGTPNDIISSFSTADFGSNDPEGLAFDTHRGHLFSVDGIDEEVFDISPGVNGVFDGIPPTGDDEVTSFDVFSSGLRDPEGIAYNAESNTLFVGDRSSARIIETTIDGTLLRTFNLTPETVRIAGLTVAPGTANPDVLSLYIADRAVDNNVDPQENDGKIYELVIPSPTSPSGTCSSGPVVKCSLGTLQGGDLALVTIVAEVDILATGSLTNTVEVNTSTPDNDSDTATIETPVTTKADLSLTKTDYPDPVTAGEKLTYTLTINNLGPSHATGVIVEDTLPAGTTISSTQVSQGSGCLGDTKIECELGDILAGTQATVTLVVDVAASAQFSITNEAEVKSLTTDDFLDNNFVTEVTTVTTEADLTISKAGWPDPVTAGTNLTYTLVVTNIGPSDALGVVVTDTLPAGVNLASAEASQGSGCSTGSSPVCDLGTLAVNSQASITLVVTVTSGVSTTLQNIADLDALTSDPFLENNQAQGLTSVVSVAALSLVKEASPEPVNAGAELTYTLTISNAGPSDAYGVVVTDTLPAGASYVIAESSQGIDCSSNGQVVCQLDAVTIEQEVVVTLVTRLDSSLTAQQITNSAEVSSEASDPDETNNTDSITSTIQTAADLTISKIDSEDPIVAGKNLTYTLTVQNLGPSDALSLTVTDTLPVGVSLLTVASSQGSECLGDTVITCELGDLAQLATASITIEVNIDSATLGTIENSAEVTSLTTDSDTENNTVSEFTTVEAGADLAISKAAWPETVTAGTYLTYTLTVSNSGPSDAVGVVVTDTLPAGVTLLTADTSQGPGCDNNGNVVCNLQTMLPNTQATITLMLQVSSGVSSTLHNTAEVAAATADPFPDNNEAQVDTTIITVADLSLMKEATPEPVIAGSILTYTLTISNAGPSDAASVVVSDTLPNEVTLVSADSSQGAGCVENSAVVCQLGTVTSGQEVIVTITVSLDPALQPQSIVNTASVSSETTDPVEANNGDTITSTVQIAADLAISKQATPDPVTAGENLTYTLTIQNLGSSNATGIVVTDTLPAATSFITVTASQGSGCNGTTVITCDVGDLELLASAEITIVVAVDSAASGTITNTAEVKGEQQDPQPENNQISFITSVNREGALPFVKTDTPDPVTAGTNLTYTLSVSSTGPSDAMNVILTDTLPAGVQFLSVTQDRGDCSESLGVVTCQLGDMPVGTDATVEIVVTVDTDTLGQINNEATVTADGTESSDVSQNTNVVSSADLSITNDAEPNRVTPGDNITFTIEVTNSGPSLARAVVVNNTLPSDVSFSSSPDCVLDINIVTCDLGDLDQNESAQTYFVVEVGSNASGLVSSVAAVLSKTDDPQLGNNTSMASTEVVPESDLLISKSVLPEEAFSGDTITYTLTVTNDGPALATSVQVVDTLPDEVEKLSATTSQGAGCFGASTILCQLGDLDSGSTATITIVAQIDEFYYGLLENSAVVSGDQTDPNETNNTAVLEITVGQSVFRVFLPIIVK